MVTRLPALYLTRCPTEVQTLHSRQFLGKPFPDSRKADADGIGRNAENFSRFSLAETIPHKQSEQFLIVGSHSSKRLEGWRLGSMERRAILRLGAESEPQQEAAARSAVVVGENPASCGQQPGQRGFRLRQAINPAPRDRKGLGHCVLGVGLIGGASEGEGQNGPVVLLEGSLKARDVSCGHSQGTNSRRCMFPQV